MIVDGVRFFGTGGCCDPPLDVSCFVLVELCVFCAVRREGDKVKQYSRCWSGSPLLSSLGSPRAYSNDINMPCVCVYVCLFVHISTCMGFE